MHTFSGAVTDCHLARHTFPSNGRAELRNVAVLVIEDKNLYIAPARFQMQALLGYPVLAALGRITFHADGRSEARPSLASQKATVARLLLGELTLLVVIGTSTGDQLFRLDGCKQQLFDGTLLARSPKRICPAEAERESDGRRQRNSYYSVLHSRERMLNLAGTPLTLGMCPCSLVLMPETRSTPMGTWGRMCWRASVRTPWTSALCVYTWLHEWLRP